MSKIPPEEDFFPESELLRLDRRTWILSYAPKGGVGAEFGVFRGHFAEKIVETIEPSKLFLVDPWTKEGVKFEWGDDPYTNFNQLTTLQAKEDCRARMTGYVDTGMVELVEMYGHEFIDLLLEENRRLDFVYLDTSHRYEETIAELKNIDRILQPDGVIMGDDWTPDRGHIHHGVFRAVNAFIKENDYEIVAAGPGAQYCLRRCE